MRESNLISKLSEQQTLDLLTKSVAPITPYLSEELNRHSKNTEESIFKNTWTVLVGVSMYDALFAN